MWPWYGLIFCSPKAKPANGRTIITQWSPFMLRSHLPTVYHSIFIHFSQPKAQYRKTNKQNKTGSLVAYWLGFRAFTAMVQVQSLVKELRSWKPWGTAKKKKKERKKKAKLQYMTPLGSRNYWTIIVTITKKALRVFYSSHGVDCTGTRTEETFFLICGTLVV